MKANPALDGRKLRGALMTGGPGSAGNRETQLVEAWKAIIEPVSLHSLVEECADFKPEQELNLGRPSQQQQQQMTLGGP